MLAIPDRIDCHTFIECAAERLVCSVSVACWECPGSRIIIWWRGQPGCAGRASVRQLPLCAFSGNAYWPVWPQRPARMEACPARSTLTVTGRDDEPGVPRGGCLQPATTRRGGNTGRGLDVHAFGQASTTQLPMGHPGHDGSDQPRPPLPPAGCASEVHAGAGPSIVGLSCPTTPTGRDCSRPSTPPPLRPSG